MKNHTVILRRSAALLLVLFSCFITCVPQPASAVSAPEQAAAISAVLMDADSGQIIFDQNGRERIEPASTTKILTAMMVVEAAERGEISLDDEVTARAEIIDNVVWDASRVLPYIQDGEKLTVREYLYCVLLSSCCISCDVLADYVCGSVDEFVKRMNDRASGLGCTDSCFLNTHGYPTEGHYSTARDLCIITEEAVRHPEFVGIFGTIKHTVPATNLNGERKLYNTNWIIWDPEKITSIYCKYYYPNATGGKTGSSKKTGNCLVSTAEKNGVRLICALIGTNHIPETDPELQGLNRSFTETQRLYEWGFANYSVKEIVSASDVVGRINVTGSTKESVPVETASAASALLPNDVDPSLVEREISFDSGDTVEAPLPAGKRVGLLNIWYNGYELCSVPVVTSEDADVPLIKPAAEGGISDRTIFTMIIVVVAVASVLLLIVNYEPKKKHR